MLVTLKNKGLKKPMNLTGVSRFVYGNENLHTHNNNTTTETTYIDHTVNNSRKEVKDVFVINADPTR